MTLSLILALGLYYVWLSSSYLHGCKGTYGARIESHNDCGWIKKGKEKIIDNKNKH